jgi:hypothetical protein
MPVLRKLIFRFTQTVLLLGFFTAVMAQAPDWKWVKAVYEPSRLYAYDVAVESFSGEAVVVGSWQPDLSAFWGDGIRPSTDFSVTYGAADGFVVRYDTSGNVIWSFKIGGPSMDEVRSVTIDPGGDIYITGKIGDGLSTFAGTSSLTADSTISNADNTDCFIAKYNRGGELIWLRSSIGSDMEVSGKTIFTNQSAVFIAWDFSGNLTLESYTFPVTARNIDVFLAKFDLDGNLSAILQIQANRQLKVGYSYGYELSGLSSYQHGSHEVLLQYNFRYIMDVVNPRFFLNIT